ncbi:MAG: hypothetical protein Q9177_005963 [Variospora cf. flavescens]
MSLTPPFSTTPQDDIYGHSPTAFPTPIDEFATSSTDDPSPTSTLRGIEPDDRPNDGILNYYFLLLALVIIILGIIYVAIIKRRRQKLARSRLNGQRALAMDLERSSGSGPWGPGRLRMPRPTARHHLSQRREEGLDERGEAPPPYVPKEPEPAYTRGVQRNDGLTAGSEIPLRDLSGFDRKPPDYNEGPSSACGLRDESPVMRS